MITVKNLHKSFGGKPAVDGVSFSVAKGEILGFLGPNGAGKSTTMRMVTGYFPAQAGGVRIGDFDMAVNPVAAKKLIGYLPENAPSYADMDVEGFLVFAARLRGLFGEAGEKAVENAVRTCFLEPVRFQSIETLSKGYRHRVCFAQSILHDPEVLVLDEPTDGLDPNQKHEVRSLIREMGKTKAILFSTHILEEVEAVCSRAIIIDRGKIVASGTPSELKAGSARSLFLRVADASLEEVAREIAKLRGADRVEVDGTGLRITLNRDARTVAREVSALCAGKHWPLEELTIEEARLEDVFRELTTGDAQR